MRSTPRRIAATLTAAVVGASGVIVTSPAATLGGAPAGGKLRVGRNHKLGSERRPARARDVPGVAVDPNDPRHIVEVDQEYRNQHCTYRVSFNQGKTWRGGNLRGPKDFPKPICPPLDQGGYAHLNQSVSFGSANNVYTTFSGDGGDEGEGDSILVAKSTNGGRTFRRAVVAIPGERVGDVSYIQPELTAVPRDNGDLVFLDAWGVVSPRQGAGAGKEIVSATSTDGGATFDGPVRLSTPDELASMQSQPIVGLDGAVYIAYRQFAPDASLKLAVSNDRGRIWKQQTISGVAAEAPKLAVDPNDGTLYVAYQAEAGGDNDIFLRRSTDKGATWSEAVRVNDARGSAAEQLLPRVSVAPGGRVDVVWYDQRHFYPGAVSEGHFGANVTLQDVYYAYSIDQGRTFSRNRRITDRTNNNDVGVRNEIGLFWGPVLAPLGSHKVLVVWADSRQGNVDNDTQDIFLAKVDLRSSGQVPVQTLRGKGPVQTSVALSRRAYPGGREEREDKPVTKVVIVNKSDVPGALAGSVLARANVGPVLLSKRSRLPKQVGREVARLKPVGAFMIGSGAALGKRVKRDLARRGVPKKRIVRVAGTKGRLRTANARTARRLAGIMDTRSEEDRNNDEPAFEAAAIVNPAKPSASAVSALAAALRFPVLFVRPRSVPKQTSKALQQFDIPKTFVVGGRRDVAANVARRLPNPTRLAGATPYAISKSVLRESVSRGVATNIVYATKGGRNILGSLLGAAVARLGGLTLLSSTGSPSGARNALRRLGLNAVVDRLVIVGGRR